MTRSLSFPPFLTYFSLLFLVATDILSAQLVTLETVPVGDINNAAYRSSGERIGSVAYSYEIAKYEVTLAQYAVFLNAVAKSNNAAHLVDLWDSAMQFDTSVAGISRRGSGSATDPYVYAVIGNGDRPVADVSWFSAARFANWVNNGATESAGTESGSYNLNRATNGFINPNPSAVWRLPTADEWFKAAYYKGGGTNAGYWRYATRSDSSPGNVVGAAANQANYRVRDRFAVTQATVYLDNQNYLTPVGAFTGSPSAYNTFDQTGNVIEWTDEIGVFPLPGGPSSLDRIAFGGSWRQNFEQSAPEASSVDRNARWYASPDSKVYGFRLVKVSGQAPSPTPTPVPTATPNIKKSQAITFRLPAKIYYDGSYILAAKSPSNLPFTYSVSDPSAARVEGNNLRVLRVVPFFVTAVQAGDANWFPATRTISVKPLKRPQRIAFTVKAIATVNETLNLSITPDSALPVTITSSNPNVVRVNSNNTATALAKGRAVLVASQAGDVNHVPAVAVRRTIVVK